VFTAANDGHGEGVLKQNSELAYLIRKQEIAVFCWVKNGTACPVKAYRLNDVDVDVDPVVPLSLVAQSESHFV